MVYISAVTLLEVRHIHMRMPEVKATQYLNQIRRSIIRLWEETNAGRRHACCLHGFDEGFAVMRKANQ